MYFYYDWTVEHQRTFFLDWLHFSQREIKEPKSEKMLIGPDQARTSSFFIVNSVFPFQRTEAGAFGRSIQTPGIRL